MIQRGNTEHGTVSCTSDLVELQNKLLKFSNDRLHEDTS